MSSTKPFHPVPDVVVRARTREVGDKAPTPQTTAAPRNLTDLSGRTAVVICGTSGLGRAIAVGMAESGAAVVPVGRRADRLEEVCREVERLGRPTIRHTVDVADRDSIDALRAAVERQLGGVDILVNAAGRTLKKSTAAVTEPEWAELMDTNLTGTLRACQTFYPALRASGRGRIINIASLASFLAFHEVAAYAASKAGVLALTRSLAIEWVGDGIMVNAIVPGIFPTDLNASILNDTPRGRELLMRTPIGRFGRPQEVVGPAVFLASDCASFITGQTIAVDGGFLASGANT